MSEKVYNKDTTQTYQRYCGIFISYFENNQNLYRIPLLLTFSIHFGIVSQFGFQY